MKLFSLFPLAISIFLVVISRPCEAQLPSPAYPAMRQMERQMDFDYGNRPAPRFMPRRAYPGYSYPTGYATPGYATTPGQAGWARSAGSQIVSDQPWTQHLIKKEDRFFDFKTVAKGTHAEHRFILKNRFQETVHIASIHSSCTCTSATVLDDKNEIQTYEETAIVAHFHTDRFDGFKNATITVQIDRPLPAEIQLNVQGEIRSDISIVPNSVLFGAVAEGAEASRTITVTYSGPMANWKILDFKSSNEHVTGEVVDFQARPRMITTKVKIKLDEKTPRGEISERLALVTNDSQNRREIPIVVRANVGKSVKVSPSVVFLGFREPGKISDVKDVTLRGTKRFRIMKLLCDNPEVQVDFTPSPDDPAKFLYKIPVRYTNPKDGPNAPKDGKMIATVRVETDDPDLQPTFSVRMDLEKKPEPAEEPEEKATETAADAAQAP